MRLRVLRVLRVLRAAVTVPAAARLAGRLLEAGTALPVAVGFTVLGLRGRLAEFRWSVPGPPLEPASGRNRAGSTQVFTLSAAACEDLGRIDLR